MIRGTTPKHTFILPFDTNLIEKVYITYKQELAFGKAIKIERGKDADANLDTCEFDGNKIIIVFTQEETLMLVHGVEVEIQARIKMLDGNAYASNIIRKSVGEILKDGEL